MSDTSILTDIAPVGNGSRLRPRTLTLLAVVTETSPSGVPHDATYSVTSVPVPPPRPGERAPQVVKAWRMAKSGGDFYDVALWEDGLVTCDCRGFVRWSHCKHSQAAQAIMKAFSPH